MRPRGERILLVDDEARFSRALARGLEGHGYTVQQSPTVVDAQRDFVTFRPDVVLLDLMLPDGEGIDLCRELRQGSDVAIIVLSVIGAEQMKVRALDEGADDYLTKPFGTDELLARIRAALRRSVPPPASGVLGTGSVWLDVAQSLATVNGLEVHLTPTECKLLSYLVSNAGRVLRHAAILNNVWGQEYADDTRILRTYINQLRDKLGDDPSRPRYIRTEPGIGYRFMRES